VVLVEALVFLVALALILRRNLSALARLPYHGGWKLVGGIVSLFVLQALFVIYAPGQTIFQLALLVLSQVALLLLLLVNRHLVGAKLFALGLILNIAVMVANGGWMPITPETYHFVYPNRTIEVHARPTSSKNIVLSHSETNLWILSDIIPIPLPWHRSAMSIGDLFLILGAACFIFINSKNKEEVVTLKDSAT
jgi:hypothetical protein